MDGFRRCASTFISPTLPCPEMIDSGSPKKTPPRASYYRDDMQKKSYFVPTLPLSSSLPRITSDTLAALLSGDYDEFFDDLFVVDCRYDYEYEGGCIKGAINITNPEIFTDGFFSNPFKNAVIVFHCEFSHNRGPQLAGIFRELDRDKNKMSYPHLFYPNVFVLDGGFRQFYQEHPDLCDGTYVPMLDEFHRTNGDLTRATTQFRKNVEKLENQHRKALVSLNRSTTDFLKSPVAFGSSVSSPISSRMLNFMASPVQQRRL